VKKTNCNQGGDTDQKKWDSQGKQNPSWNSKKGNQEHDANKHERAFEHPSSQVYVELKSYLGIGTTLDCDSKCTN
jgi:hypothetical protein